MKQRHELKENIRFSSFHGYTALLGLGHYNTSTSTSILELLYLLRSFLDFCYATLLLKEKKERFKRKGTTPFLVLGYW
jgi:hypothetical protein